MVDQRIHLERARKKRWEGKTKEQKAAAAAQAGKARWAGKTPEEISEAMKKLRAKATVKRKRKKR